MTFARSLGLSLLLTSTFSTLCSGTQQDPALNFLGTEKDQWEYIRNSLTNRINNAETMTNYSGTLIQDYSGLSACGTILVYYLFSAIAEAEEWDYALGDQEDWLLNLIGDNGPVVAYFTVPVSIITMYVLIKKLFVLLGNWLKDTPEQSHQALISAVRQWHKNADEVPASLKPLVESLYQKIQSGNNALTPEESAQVVAKLLLVSELLTA